MTGDTSTSMRSMEGSARCSTGVHLLRSSWEVVASFAKASAWEFSAVGICLTWTNTNFFSNSHTFFRYRTIFSPLAQYVSSICLTTSWESLQTSSWLTSIEWVRLRPAMTASYSASLLEAWNPNLSTYSISIPYGEARISPAPLP